MFSLERVRAVLGGKKHLTARYLVDRVNLALWGRAHPGHPWLAPAAVELVAEWLRPTDVVVEFGSGRSTSWFARHAGRVVSIEHDPTWYRIVSEQLARAGLTNVALHLVPEEVEAYLAPAEAGLEGHADLVLVDGYNRDHSALWATERIAPGGLIVVDNANWFLPSASRSPSSIPPHGQPASEAWARFLEVVSTWRRSWFCNGVADTLVVFAPPDKGQKASGTG